MAAIGFDGSVNEAQWSKVFGYAARAHNDAAVFSGLDVTLSGTRTVSVTGGVALFPGVVDEAVAAANFTLTSGSVAHTDTVVATANWSTNAVTLAVRAGTSLTPATLTQTPGVLWNMPLAYVTVPTGTSTMTVTPCKPLPRIARTLRGSDVAAGSINYSSTGQVVSQVTATDPGWPYVLEVQAQLRVSASGGFGQIDVTASSAPSGGPGGGTADLLARSYSGLLANAASPVTAVDTSGTRTGPTTIQLTVLPASIPTGTQLQWGTGPMNHLTVRQVPA